jgi:DNA-binding Xre family transcriptional regulator
MVVRLRIKEVAREKGVGMGKLQRTADVAYNTVKRMFRDPYYITTTETLGKIAKALGVPPGSLIEEALDEEVKGPLWER